MQSGISASHALHSAFNTLVSSPTQRALFATIDSESLIPTTTIPLSSPSASFTADLPLLQPHLSPTTATYILLKLHAEENDGFAAITFVPNAAPVRQKMLFASTRLTLVRELGLERFRQTLFVTEKEELTAEGWARHEASESVAPPLTEEESGLIGVREAEAQEARGTGARRGHVAGRVDVKVADGVVEALTGMREGSLVMLKYELPDETLRLDGVRDGVVAAEVGAAISADEPRYAFYSPADGSGIVYIYTCPSTSKIKERMIYSTGKSWTRIVAERDAGLTIAKSVEATEPSELTEDMFGPAPGASTPQDGQDSGRSTPAAGGFARPKRPGRR